MQLSGAQWPADAHLQSHVVAVPEFCCPARRAAALGAWGSRADRTFEGSCVLTLGEAHARENGGQATRS